MGWGRAAGRAGTGRGPIGRRPPIRSAGLRARNGRCAHMTFRGGRVFKAHRLCVSVNLRLDSNKEEQKRGGDPCGVRACARGVAGRREEPRERDRERKIKGERKRGKETDSGREREVTHVECGPAREEWQVRSYDSCSVI